jgi:hypothetical protein
LLDHREAIEKLINSGYTHKQIYSYLVMNNVICTLQSLKYFIRKHLKSISKPAVLDRQSKSSAIKPSIESFPPQKSVNNQSDLIDKKFSQQLNVEDYL